MNWLVVLVAVVGCKYPDPGLGMPLDDASLDDADIDTGDGMPGDEMVTQPCLEPMTIDNMVVIPGKAVAGFSPAEDESYAMSWLSGMNPGYTESPLGVSYSPTNISNAIVRGHISPDGNVMYFFEAGGVAGMRIRRTTRQGDNATWSTPVWSGLPDAFPGRPTADDQTMVFLNDTDLEELVRDAGTWTGRRAYGPVDFGNELASTFTSGNLSPDGAFLLYTLEGPNENGIHLRVRGGGTFDGFDGAYGRGLVSGPYRDAVLVANCTKLYVYNTMSQHVERWDVHP